VLTSDDIVDNTIKQLDLDNMGVADEILSVGVLELQSPDNPGGILPH